MWKCNKGLSYEKQVNDILNENWSEHPVANTVLYSVYSFIVCCSGELGEEIRIFNPNAVLRKLLCVDKKKQ